MINYNEMLKAKLNHELEEIALKKGLTERDLELAHAITDTIKNLDKIAMLESGNYPATAVSYAEISTPSGAVSISSDSNFADLIRGKDSEKVWKVIEELVDAVMVRTPKLHKAFCEKLESI